MAKPQTIFPGNTFESKNYGTAVVLDYQGIENITIQFLNTGHITTSTGRNLRSGKFKDNTAPTICGVACVGEGPHKPSEGTRGKQYIFPTYTLWNAMIHRVYDPKCHVRDNGVYEGCSVDPIWLNYQTFCETIVNVPGYQEWADYQVGVSPVQYALDKDKKLDGNRIYSPDTCMFITVSENTLIANKSRK